MKKLFASILALLLLLCACANDPQNEILSDTSENSSESAKIDFDYYLDLANDEAENEFEKPSQNESLVEFTFEVPDLSDADMSELPFIYENPEWCVNGTDWIQTEKELFYQYLCPGEEAEELAKAIALLYRHDGLFGGYYGGNSFDSITEANEKELLWAAILRTPYRRNPESENHALNVILEAGSTGSEYELFAVEVYSVSDVEKTFRWLFGEEAEFVPQSIPLVGIRYFEEIGLFVQFFDGITISQSFPQIISYSEKDGVYTVEAVLAGAYPDGQIGFEVKLTDGTYGFYPVNEENLLLLSDIFDCRTYTFEKAEDGHFVLTGFSK